METQRNFTANAKTLILSFWVKSNKTGTYAINVRKQDTTQYIVPIEYTISSANTWEKKTIHSNVLVKKESF